MAYTENTKTSQINRHAEYLKSVGQKSGRCNRCEGLMVREFCFDLHDETGKNGFWAFRCMQYGEILDPLILQNRLVQDPVLIKGRARRKEVIAASTS